MGHRKYSKEEGKGGKKVILNLNQILAEGKVTRDAQAETRREEILLLYIPCPCRASVGLGEWFAKNHQWDRGIVTSLQAILTHKSLPKQLHQQTHK